MIYYANPGFNELLVNPTKKSDTNIDKKKTHIGTYISLNKSEYYALYETDTLFKSNEYYFDFDLYITETKGNTNNYTPLVRFKSDNEKYPYIDMILDNQKEYNLLFIATDGINNIMQSNLLSQIENRKNGVDTSSDTFQYLFEIEQMGLYKSITNFDIHINMRTENSIELWINNVVYKKVDISKWFNTDNIINTYIGSNIDTSYISSIIAGNEILKGKKSILVPTKIDSTTWTKKNNLYYADSNNQKMNFSSNTANFLDYDYYISNQVNIHDVLFGATTGYSEGTEHVELSIDNVPIETIVVDSNKNKGFKSKVLDKNPSNDFTWNVNSLSQANFTIKSKENI